MFLIHRKKAYINKLERCAKTFEEQGSFTVCGRGCCNITGDLTISSQNVITNQSTKMRQAQLTKNLRNGKTVYAYGALYNPFIVNYLGRMEGQPGGSGMPPRNSFV